jgi:hypothetical protein
MQKKLVGCLERLEFLVTTSLCWLALSLHLGWMQPSDVQVAQILLLAITRAITQAEKQIERNDRR